MKNSELSSFKVAICVWICCLGGAQISGAESKTRIEIRDGKWFINGQVTYPGTKGEGLLMNVRMVNSTFEDRNKLDFVAATNTRKFIEQIPDYAAHGVRAFTLCLQGGMPGYEGAVNSAFEPDGSLRPPYLERVARVIKACDQQGIAIILGCYYQRQDQILKDAEAVRNGVRNGVRWIKENGWRHVLLEIANEYDHRGFDHEIIKTADGQVELIRLAKKEWPELLVSTSGLGHGRMNAKISEAADFILIHFNGTSLEDIPARIQALKKFNKPIVVNEDDKDGEEGARAAELSVDNGASWGLMLNDLNQYVPFEFKGGQDDPLIYRKLKELTSR